MESLCSKCNKNKRQISLIGEIRSWCKECSKKQYTSYYNTHKEQSFKRSMSWRLKNRDKYLELLNKSVNKRRLLVLNYYSDGKLECACCKDRNIEFLSIDHINGGGRKHRKEIGDGGQSIYSWLKVNNFPKGYQVLCHNCNCSLGHYGYCPHIKADKIIENI